MVNDGVDVNTGSHSKPNSHIPRTYYIALILLVYMDNIIHVECGIYLVRSIQKYLTCCMCPLVLLVCLNLPPWIRYLPGFVVVVGLIPAGYKNVQIYMQLIADQFDGLKDGIIVFDSIKRKEVRLNKLLSMFVLYCIASLYRCQVHPRCSQQWMILQRWFTSAVRSKHLAWNGHVDSVTHRDSLFVRKTSLYDAYYGYNLGSNSTCS